MKCSDSSRIRPEGAICSYNGYLSVPSLTPERAEQLESAAQTAGLTIDVGSKSIEFAFEGRDTNLFVVAFLRHVAAIIGTASGEIRCEIAADQADPCFEFFRISNGRLFRQLGEIVRQPEEDVSLQCS